MTLRHTLLALAAAAVACSAAHAIEPVAQSNSPQADASLYGESVMLPRQAAACSERIADYPPRFQRAYDAWRAQNADRLAAGSRFMHESAQRGGVDADAGMAKLGDAEVERLRKTSLDMLAHHCQLMLDSMAPAPD